MWGVKASVPDQALTDPIQWAEGAESLGGREQAQALRAGLQGSGAEPWAAWGRGGGGAREPGAGPGLKGRSGSSQAWGRS